MIDIELAASDLAAKWYDAKKFQHAARVANYAIKMSMDKTSFNEEDDSIIYAIAILHDILEDTKCPKEDARKVLWMSDKIKSEKAIRALDLVTKDKDEAYSTYIQQILDSNNEYAYIVKKADLKDHYSQLETLTPKLIEKYSPIIGYFI